jgi:hypothetical protein
MVSFILKSLFPGVKHRQETNVPPGVAAHP